ncbi:MAG: murein biosynthesis integral membrane protein MurJ [Chloroflexi bacterium]|nr:murein biosynthesis integral membrane protein MurJ [Chloroflexota bacterium]
MASLPTVNTSANRQIARAAGTVMAAFALSQLLGLARSIVMSSAFGTSSEVDAFYAAAKLPDILFNLVAGGALASAFIPTFTGFLTKDDRRGAWELASSVANLVTLVLVGVAGLAALFAPQIVGYILAPHFPPAEQALTASLLRVLLPSAVIFGLSGLLMGILNSHQSFLLPALAPSMYWLGIIFGVVALSPTLGIYGPAWGAVIGAGLHLAVQIPGLFRLAGRRYFASLGLRLPAVREVARLMGPRLFGVAVVQINGLVNIILATGMTTGSITGITYGFAIMTVPQIVIAQAIAIAAMPTFSAQVARGRSDEMRHSLAATLRGVLLLSLPAMLGLILLRQPLVAAFLQRGAFDAHSTDLVAWALLWYAAGLVGHSVVEVVSRAFYAMHDTLTPVLVGAGAMTLNVVFSLVFSSAFARIGWAPHGGLALANSLATALEMVGLLVLMRRKLGGLGGNLLLRGLVQAAVGTVIMSLGVVLWMGWAQDRANWAVTLGGVAVGGVVYAAAMLGLRVPEMGEVIHAIRRRLRIA